MVWIRLPAAGPVAVDIATGAGGAAWTGAGGVTAVLVLALAVALAAAGAGPGAWRAWAAPPARLAATIQARGKRPIIYSVF